jgi:hypothetical protein
MVPPPREARQGHVVDYLAQARGERAKRAQPSTLEKRDWSGELRKGLTKDNLKSRIRQMEILAARQEIVLAESGPRELDTRIVDVEENVNDVLIESIKAKLALLDDFM